MGRQYFCMRQTDSSTALSSSLLTLPPHDGLSGSPSGWRGEAHSLSLWFLPCPSSTFLPALDFCIFGLHAKKQKPRRKGVEEEGGRRHQGILNISGKKKNFLGMAGRLGKLEKENGNILLWDTCFCAWWAETGRANREQTLPEPSILLHSSFMVLLCWWHLFAFSVSCDTFLPCDTSRH